MKKMLYIVFALTLVACESTVIFLEPQPEGKKDLRSFPARYRGIYMETGDSSIFKIMENRILERHEASIAESVDLVLEEGDVELTDDSILVRDLELSFPAEYRNDSVFARLLVYDTVFDISRGEILRKMGRNYFLNMPGDSLWRVIKLSFKGSAAVYRCDIDHETEMEIFTRHCNVDIETDKEGNPRKYYLSPTRKELKKLLRLETFTDTTRYIRVAQEELR